MSGRVMAEFRLPVRMYSRVYSGSTPECVTTHMGLFLRNWSWKKLKGEGEGSENAFNVTCVACTFPTAAPVTLMFENGTGDSVIRAVIDNATLWHSAFVLIRYSHWFPSTTPNVGLGMCMGGGGGESQESPGIKGNFLSQKYRFIRKAGSELSWKLPLHPKFRKIFFCEKPHVSVQTTQYSIFSSDTKKHIRVFSGASSFI